MTVKVRKLYKRDRVASEFIEGSRVVYRTEEPASRTNPTGIHDDIELEREASLHGEFTSGVASPSEGGPSKVRRRYLLPEKNIVPTCGKVPTRCQRRAQDERCPFLPDVIGVLYA